MGYMCIGEPSTYDINRDGFTVEDLEAKQTKHVG